MQKKVLLPDNYKYIVLICGAIAFNVFNIHWTVIFKWSKKEKEIGFSFNWVELKIIFDDGATKNKNWNNNKWLNFVNILLTQ